ncbi:MAG: hypothetical protein WED00_11920 [Aquisalimonadaceae bacterium]
MEAVASASRGSAWPVPLLVITVDTEADDAWGDPERIALKNVAEIPRFQDLCERHGAMTTYLVAYECATRDESLRILQPLVAQGRCEIGHHLHVWTTPPFAREHPRGVDAEWIAAYQYQLPEALFTAKADCLHAAIEDSFGVAPTAHRAGRWGVDQRTIDWLIRRGYAVDTSVTPITSWRRARCNGVAGPSFARHPRRPYLWAGSDAHADGHKDIVEIPVSVHWRGYAAIDLYCRSLDAGWAGAGLARRVLRRLVAPRMVRPNPRYPLHTFTDALEQAVRRRVPVVNLMLHSSELAYGCSPSSATRDDLARVWERLALVLRRAGELGMKGTTLTSAALALRQPVAGSLATAAPAAAHLTAREA